MKIVHVGEWNPHSGGGYNAMKNLLDSICKLSSDFDVHVVSFANKNLTIKENNLTVHYLYNKNKSSLFHTYFFESKVLKKKIEELMPDIIHLHFTIPPYSFLCTLDIPVVITTHGLSSIRIKGSHAIKSYFSLRYFLDRYYERKALEKCTKIIAVSKWIQHQIEGIITQKSKIVHIPNGINFMEYSSNNKIGNLNHPSIFFIGRLVKFKGVDILINSLLSIKKVYPTIHLYVAGEGPQYKNLISLVLKNNLSSNVTFMGYIDNKTKIKMFTSCDVFVIPSRYETFGIVVLEALASGIPVVGSRTGGISEILADNTYGLLFNPFDSDDLAHKVCKLLNDDYLMDYYKHQGTVRANQFLWDDVAKDVLNLYSELDK